MEFAFCPSFSIALATMTLLETSKAAAFFLPSPFSNERTSFMTNEPRLCFLRLESQVNAEFGRAAARDARIKTVALAARTSSHFC